ncbi:MAG: DNA helicase [Planctomycetaceae bacterium]|nr:DNA helicase [Planctomycetaceae bacterium]
MTTLADFLRDRFEVDGFTTEDALASFLPLAREVLDAHAAGMAAPLDGLDELRVEGVRIWFEEAKRREVRRVSSDLQRIERAGRAAVEIVSETRITTELDDGVEKVVDLAIGDADETPTRPIYLPGYRCWEHRLGVHDPLTDVFALGMILASLACGLDFFDKEQLEEFVAHRKNLFALNSGLHPVIARVIVRMTQLDRRDRAQDLASLVKTLQSYRDQEVDFEFDLAHSSEFAKGSKRDRQTVILAKLRERLFEISRRNKLLHFRPTMQSVNLTHASVPLSFDIQSIRPGQILVWNDRLHREVTGGKPISLNKYLNFSEVLYLPSQLERLIAEARRDQSEFGFAQLRLVICFLHWANLKEKPVEQYDSPLVLLPVQLRKKKGIRDTYYLDVVSTEAEINPVIRHQFKQLYDISLPESIDLATSSLDGLFELLSRKIAASESAVNLTKIDRPRIALIHEKARRKLDQYRRRARLAGRGVRKYLDLDYSYDPANYHPLGIKLFGAKVRPAQTHLREIIEEKPRPRTFATAEPDPPVAEKERQFYALQSGGEANPYDWTFDLCSVTLANFKYRRMSLVRDYEALLGDGLTNPAFEATFSLAPRPIDNQPLDARALADRFDVVPCDPTQARAIAEAELGKSFIIQGPPGTGKSQTITNLIADYVARGKRVLFVCEKRAAIDVVYARLRQCGLADLCCLIHDSQTDKKEFVMDLKQSYEKLLESPQTKSQAAGRGEMIQQLSRTITPLDRFSAAMQSDRPELGTSARDLLDRCIELRRDLPELDALTREQLPTHAEWLASRSAVGRFERALADAGGGKVLAEHPMRILSPRLASEEHPLETISHCVREAIPQLDQAEQLLGRCGVPRSGWEPLERAVQLTQFASRLKEVAEAGLVHLLDPQHEQARWLGEQVKALQKSKQAVTVAEQVNVNWAEKLTAEETGLALEQARQFEQARFAWLSPAWWRLRSVLKRGYRFGAHKIRPPWSRVLEQLASEHEAVAARRRLLQETADRLGVDVEAAPGLIETIGEVSTHAPKLPRWLSAVHAALVKSPRAGEIVARVLQAKTAVESAHGQLARISDSAAQLPLAELKSSLKHVSNNLESVPDFLECIRELRATPQAVAAALRTLPHTPREIEAAVADRGLAELYRQDKQFERFTARTRHALASRLEGSYDQWLGLNAAEIRDRVRRQFLKSLHVTEQPAAKLSAEEKEFKRRYNRGRRELEHEFGKQMRYKAIRDLVSDESGDVVNDLKPVWLMSPLSVSDTLPLSPDRFDVVIFDEASQITLEEAVPALFRAAQSIIVGDEMQLPPTDFFSAKQSAEEEEELLVESDGELVQYDLDSGSFLSHAAKNLPSTMLGWHYRSRSESLISFSNWAFYDGRLLTVPEESLANVQREPIVAESPEHGAVGAQEALARPISFHLLRHGVYDKRRNRAEAEYIAEMVRQVLTDSPQQTIGIVAFSEAQQDEIEQALTRLAADDKPFGEALEQAYEREDDGQFVGLLVKNLENIQGDERDIIILSVCYGRPPTGKMRMNFGPINKSGGEKRLNVAFSRAKQYMAVVSSIESTEITNDYNDGANCLKSYLRYAEAVSAGDAEAAARVTRSLSRWTHDEQDQATPARELLAEQLAERLAAAGYQVDHAVGQSHFRCDLAVHREGDSVYRLGILIDGCGYYEQSDLLERDMMRPRLLRAFGWRIVHVLAKDWYADSQDVMDRLVAILEGGEIDDDEDVDLELDDLDVTNDSTAIEEDADASAGGDTNQQGGDSDAAGSSSQGSRRFELRDGKSSKFWEISLAGEQHSVTFGRIGTTGQTRTKSFNDEAAARRDCERLIREKTKKGYVEVD